MYFKREPMDVERSTLQSSLLKYLQRRCHSTVCVSQPLCIVLYIHVYFNNHMIILSFGFAIVNRAPSVSRHRLLFRPTQCFVSRALPPQRFLTVHTSRRRLARNTPMFTFRPQNPQFPASPAPHAVRRLIARRPSSVALMSHMLLG